MSTEEEGRLAALNAGENSVAADVPARGCAVAVPEGGRVGDEDAPARAAGQPLLGLCFFEVDAPRAEWGGRDGASEPEEGDGFDLDRGCVQDVKVPVGRARGLKFVGRFAVAADEDGRAIERGDGFDDGLESLAPGGKVAGADKDVAGAGASGKGLDSAEVAVDVAERKDFHRTLPVNWTDRLRYL